MSTQLSWQFRPKPYAEFAIGAVRTVVAAARERGMKTSAALEVYAPHLDLMPRRARRLFERDRDPIVSSKECSRVLLLAARVLRRISDDLRERADHWDREADALECQQRQLELSLGWDDGETWKRSVTGDATQRRRAA